MWKSSVGDHSWLLYVYNPRKEKTWWDVLFWTSGLRSPGTLVHAAKRRRAFVTLRTQQSCCRSAAYPPLEIIKSQVGQRWRQMWIHSGRTFRGGLGHLWPLSRNGVSVNSFWATSKDHLLTWCDSTQAADVFYFFFHSSGFRIKYTRCCPNSADESFSVFNVQFCGDAEWSSCELRFWPAGPRNLLRTGASNMSQQELTRSLDVRRDSCYNINAAHRYVTGCKLTAHWTYVLAFQPFLQRPVLNKNCRL